MPMTVMYIRQVRVVMHQWGMPVEMAVRLTDRVCRRVRVLVVFVVDVCMFVLDHQT
jgi:hypothetical protein